MYPRIGFHVSIAGGVVNTPERAAVLGCETFQCFTRSPQGGPAPVLTPEIVHQFRNNMQAHGLETFYIHSPYYINFASLEERIAKSSVKIIREELERGSLLGAGYVMAHPGSHRDQTIEEGLEKVIKGIRESLTGYSGTTKFLIEISAGAGFVVGDTFEEIGEMVDGLKDLPGFGGVCFDTCHAFGAGYDFRTPEKAREVLQQFDKLIGLEWLKLSHVQDSKTELGGKRDRHEHIGDGFIGEAGLASLLQTEPFQKIDWLLETEHEKIADDIVKLKKIRGT